MRKFKKKLLISKFSNQNKKFWRTLWKNRLTTWVENKYYVTILKRKKRYQLEGIAFEYWLIDVILDVEVFHNGLNFFFGCGVACVIILFLGQGALNLDVEFDLGLSA